MSERTLRLTASIKPLIMIVKASDFTSDAFSLGCDNLNTKIDRKTMAKAIINAAESYKKNLVGKTILYVFDGQYIEVMFKAKDFKHLTGVDSSLSAQDFYKKACKGQLQDSQIFFSSRHPISLLKEK